MKINDACNSHLFSFYFKNQTMNRRGSKTVINGKKPTMVLSLQQRLPLFMSAVLLCVILTFGIASYYEVKKVSVEAGKKRLHNVTDELSAMFTQSLQGVNTIMLNVKTQEILQQFLQKKGSEEKDGALKALQKLKKDDNTWMLVELLDLNRIPVLWYGNKE